jgi:hypothetical protein
MRRPRIEDYDTNAKVPELASSLDGMPVIGKPPQKIKDAFLSPHVQEEQEKVNHPSSSVVISPVSDTPQPQAGKKQSTNHKKPASLQASKSLKQSPADLDKVEKYTTHLEPSLIKKIKLEAIEKDMKDYDVVRIALIQYFENNK